MNEKKLIEKYYKTNNVAHFSEGKYSKTYTKWLERQTIKKENSKPDGLLATEPCANCKETVKECACMRNICHKCQKTVGNITFTICDECWDIEFPPKS